MGIALSVVSIKNIRRLISLVYLLIFHMAVYSGFKHGIPNLHDFQKEITENFANTLAACLVTSITTLLIIMFFTYTFSGLNLKKYYG